MSTRGINFLDRWMAEHLPNAMTDDPVAVTAFQTLLDTNETSRWHRDEMMTALTFLELQRVS
ncbi:DUF768 domain-containing protein [Mesorhizobium sp. LNJC403B00]|uniref:DUF768 domain-containing protein n=1 Tax=unclassified Mesorhizobium TaxID=325217 RepID=UPI0003CF9185|nr:DUF768 domain-containing protein [Mesorhizobium sp. LNJC403B00]ESX87552.1 hypothetical protein X754_28010 [Mesorhizobium sp. LNJC403B00]